jgi:hypothetical protein
MTWHTTTVTASELEQLLSAIRRVGGSITHSFPCRDGYTVIYTAPECCAT